MKAIWQKLLGKMQQALQKREVDSLKSTVIILEFLIFLHAGKKHLWKMYMSGLQTILLKSGAEH